MKALTTLVVVGMFLTTVALADDVDDVKAAVQSYVAALNAGDVGAFTRLQAAASTNYGGGGGLLATFDSLEERRNSFQATVDAGVRFNVQARHIDARIYGSSTAVATNYGVGRVTQPNGTTVQVNNRITAVLIKQGGQWKVVHQHISPLRLPQ
jgi:ketosteroid isomerase-like protein